MRHMKGNCCTIFLLLLDTPQATPSFFWVYQNVPDNNPNEYEYKETPNIGAICKIEQR